MLNQHHPAPMLSMALFSLLMTACGGSDDSTGNQAAIVDCPASYAVTLLPGPPLSSSSGGRSQQSEPGRR